MQPTLCSKCKKNVAVVFISRMNEKNEMVNEGLCLKCRPVGSAPGGGHDEAYGYHAGGPGEHQQ